MELKAELRAVAGRGTMTSLSVRQASEKCMRSQEGLQQLLPGIPDDITLDKISKKMSWKVFFVLSSVSRAWLHAIRSRKVYDARILSHSPETFLILQDLATNKIVLQSTRDYSRAELPPLLYPRFSAVVPVDGKIYVLGGEDESEHPSNKVFVFDVYGQMQWKECASMNEPRDLFGCGVINGKIYVIGGFSLILPSIQPCSGSEVYDPKQDLWSPINPMGGCRPSRVISLGEELIVHRDGNYYESCLVGQFWKVYHPVNDKWRVVKCMRRDGHNLLFVARGKLHLIDEKEILIYDGKENSWTQLHSISLSSIEPAFLQLQSVEFADDELLVLLYKHGMNLCLIQSKGFGSKQKEIVWQEVKCACVPVRFNKLIQL